MIDHFKDESFRSLFEMVARDAQVLTSGVVLSYNNKRIFPSTRPDSLGLCGEVQLSALSLLISFES